MNSPKNYRIDSFVGGLAIKAPVKTVTGINLTLPFSGAGGVYTGYTVSAGDRILLNAQTDPTENGIYTVETTEWCRAGDFDGNRDIVGGTIIPVWRQAMADIVLYQIDGVPNALTIDVDSISLSVYYDSTISGISEAPIDGSPYVRQDAGWISEAAGSLPAAAISSVLVGDATGTNWVAATGITIAAVNGTLSTEGILQVSDGSEDFALGVNAGVGSISGSVGLTHIELSEVLRTFQPIFFLEKAAANADVALYGQFWVLNEADNVPMFTSDDGTDQVLDPSRSDINVQNGDYTTLITDKGKTIHKESGGAGETFTIAGEASVNYKLGTYIGFDNDGGGTVTIDVAFPDTLINAEDGTTGPRTLADGGFAVAYKNASGQWKIAGRQLS